MNQFKSMIDQYRGLRKEMYVLFIGRIVTSLGSMVWPIMTLIMNQKLGYNATQVALFTIISGVVFLPTSIIGGKLADRFNKRNIIIICDLISIVIFIVDAFLPLSLLTVVLVVIAGSCQNMEHPAYNALVADLTSTKDRERAYSLNYLGMNIGMIASPTIAGWLFQHYLWLCFLISGVAIGISTFLIFLKIHDITPVLDAQDEADSYQEAQDHLNTWQVLKQNFPVLLFLIVLSLETGAYSQWGYLMPLDMGKIHGDKGAMIYGSVNSINCLVVVLFTPFITRLVAKISHVGEFMMGLWFLMGGYGIFLLFLGKIPMYYVAMVVFTWGEILLTISNGPYLTNRIPSSHRGRINGIVSVIGSVLQAIFMYGVGFLYDNVGNVAAWTCVISVLGVAILLCFLLMAVDRKRYHALYHNS